MLTVHSLRFPSSSFFYKKRIQRFLSSCNLKYGQVLPCKLHRSHTEEYLPIYFASQNQRLRDLPFRLPDPVLEDFSFEAKKCKLVYPQNHIPRALLVGLGKENEMKEEILRECTHAAIAYAQALKKFKIVLHLPTINCFSVQRIAEVLSTTSVLSNYKFDKYLSYMLDEDESKGKKKKSNHMDEILIACEEDYHSDIKDEISIAEETLFARDIGNERADIATPAYLEQVARESASNYGLSINVLQESELREMGMNLLCSVGQAAKIPPRLVVLEYLGDDSTTEKVAFVGKGITFDSGGLNLKPTGSIEDMHADMCGAASVLGAIRSAAKLRLKKNIVAVIPLAENAIGPNAIKPKSIVKSYKGITVEIGNTDAEGRLILADALTYVQKHYKTRTIIDVATLTGACVVALGDYCAGVFSNSDRLASSLTTAGYGCYERCWPMPILPEHSKELKGTFSDIKSTGKGRYGGACTAAAFLQNFIDKNNVWAHIDIAGPSHLSSSRSFIPSGATGFGVQLLIEYLRKHH